MKIKEIFIFPRFYGPDMQEKKKQTKRKIKLKLKTQLIRLIFRLRSLPRKAKKSLKQFQMQ